ncbi:LysM peptidoglycan-binding domain-containing protein [Peribacillus sp. SCS-155]|uniref:LysM peptidoglycan-binding domain-containing protein n=1 Tax=Peribacillus sedimenti TaxID=3115297 RepID=UPI003905ED75
MDFEKINQAGQEEDRQLRGELPSRSENRRNKKKKRASKFKFPLLKLLSAFFILLPLTIYALYSHSQGKRLLEQDKQDNPYELVEVETESGIPAMASVSGILEEENTKEDTAESEAGSISDISEENAGAQGGRAEENKEKQDADDNTSISPQTEDMDINDYNLIYHTVQPKETIFRISMKYYNSQKGIPLIRKWNNLEGNEIEAGQRLIIPIPK